MTPEEVYDDMKCVPPTVIHIPHASVVVPEHIRPTLCLTDEELQHELLLMTDWYTDALFALPRNSATTVVFPVSRLVVDPERFDDDESEPMASKGMGAIYTRTSNGRSLRQLLSGEERDALLAAYYYPHHQRVRDAVSHAIATHGRCLLIDAHSFPSTPLPHEPDQSPGRCHICIGTDDFHTPRWLVKYLQEAFEQRNFTVAVDAPFAGTFVPTPFYRANRNVASVMIEVNRSLYIDEASAKRQSGFEHLHAGLTHILMDTMSVFVSSKLA